MAQDTRLASVLVEDDSDAQLNAGIMECSNYAHDITLESEVAIPAPEELLPISWRCRRGMGKSTNVVRNDKETQS